jgi:hypothetical protein
MRLAIDWGGSNYIDLTASCMESLPPRRRVECPGGSRSLLFAPGRVGATEGRGRSRWLLSPRDQRVSRVVLRWELHGKKKDVSDPRRHGLLGRFGPTRSGLHGRVRSGPLGLLGSLRFMPLETARKRPIAGAQDSLDASDPRLPGGVLGVSGKEAILPGTRAVIGRSGGRGARPGGGRAPASMIVLRLPAAVSSPPSTDEEVDSCSIHAPLFPTSGRRDRWFRRELGACPACAAGIRERSGTRGRGSARGRERGGDAERRRPRASA